MALTVYCVSLSEDKSLHYQRDAYTGAAHYVTEHKISQTV